MTHSQHPIAIPAERAAATRLFLDMVALIRASVLEHMQGASLESIDPALLVVAAAVVLGHAEARPFIQSKLAEFVNIKKSTVQDKLKVLIDCGMIVRDGTKYYLEPGRAAQPSTPLLRRYAQSLAKAIDELGPWLEKLRPSLKRAQERDQEEWLEIEDAVRTIVAAAKSLEERLDKKVPKSGTLPADD